MGGRGIAGMDKRKELSNIQLLYDVKADVMQVAEGVMSLSGVECLVDFAETAWKKGIRTLEKEIRHYPKDIPLFVDVIQGVKYILDGIDGEKLLELLVDDYWKIEQEGEKALEKYMTIVTIMKISEGVEPRALQQMLLFDVMELNARAMKGC